MPHSSNPNWTQTFSDLAHSAAFELGALAMGDTLESAEIEEMRKRCNSMLAKWSLDGALYREAIATVTIPATTGAVTLPADVRDIRAVRFVESATYKRPLAVWNRDDYLQLPNRAQAGSPTIAYYSQHIGGDQLYVWPVPATDKDFELDYNRTFFFVEEPEQELDLPPEWHEAALYGLASRCAGIFGTTRLDPGKVARCDAQAASSYQKMLDHDRPDSYRFYYESPLEAANS
jgi:hypothetical protein